MSVGSWVAASLGAAALTWGWFLAAPGAATSPVQASEEEEDWQGMPPGKGREETFYLCGACHSMKLVTQQGLSRERWDEAIDWMVEEQDMPDPEPAERTLIIDYLAKFYGPDRKARRMSKE